LPEIILTIDETYRYKNTGETVNLIKKIRNRVVKYIYTMPSVQKHGDFIHQLTAQQHLINLPSLSLEDYKLVHRLKTEGVVITSLEELAIPSSREMLSSAQNLIPLFPSVIRKNEYVLHATNKQMMENPEIFIWGLEKRILNIAENYFGLPVAYHGAYFRKDIANKVERKSRLWHMDNENRQVLKIIIYLQDVNEDQGPFQYISLETTQKLAQKLRYRLGYIKDTAMQRQASSSDYKSCLGVSGTVIFAATGSIFHRGKIPVASDRFTLFFDYTSRLPTYPFLNPYTLPQDYLRSLSRSITKYQMKSLLWHNHQLK
jgi:hypothetical protein